MKLEKADNKSKRLRKKLYLGEFAVLGFEFSCKVGVERGTEFDAFLDDVIELVESRNLIAGGGGSPEDFAMFICPDVRYGSATEGDQAAIKSWLEGDERVHSVVVGELVDAYYGI